MRPLTVLTGLSALFIAGCAAFFSITGLGLLFSGATTAVVIMATSLEIGKLVAASYLKAYWNDINRSIRVYMSISVIVLIIITSAGIFGFLSNAYSQTKIKVSQVESKVSLYENEKLRTETEINRLESRVETLNTVRTQQENRYDTLVESENWVNARRTTEQIDQATTDINDLNIQLTERYAVIDSLDQLIFQTRNENIDVEREIGGFRFVADAMGSDVDTVVKWFIFLLIVVFDPLAVAMLTAFNTIVGNKPTIYNRKGEDKRYAVYGEKSVKPEIPVDILNRDLYNVTEKKKEENDGI